MLTTSSPHRVLVVGTGLAGAAAAAVLHVAGLPVVAIDKARGPGGRMSSRRSGTTRFDHGAQDFTARTPSFVAQVARWRTAGLVQPGHLRRVHLGGEATATSTSPEPRYVAMPRMSALPRHVLGDVAAHFSCRLTALSRVDQGWHAMAGEVDLGVFRRVLLTPPAPQAIDLLVGPCPELADRLAPIAYDPCWAAMIFAEGDPGFDAARSDGPIQVLTAQHTLPGRHGPPRWVAHASPSWSAHHLDDDPAVVGEAMAEAFHAATGLTPGQVIVHRWRYARVTRPLGVDHVGHDGILVAGDGFLGCRVEAAWTSGMAAARAILVEHGFASPR